METPPISLPLPKKSAAYSARTPPEFWLLAPDSCLPYSEVSRLLSAYAPQILTPVS